VKIEIIKPIPALPHAQKGQIVEVETAVGTLYVKLGLAIEVKITPTPTPTTPTEPTKEPTKPVENSEPVPPGPIKIIKTGHNIYTPTKTSPTAEKPVNYVTPEPGAKELPKPMLPGEEIFRDSKN
jgi:hypothetical protein